jgi:hypothetical protein
MTSFRLSIVVQNGVVLVLDSLLAVIQAMALGLGSARACSERQPACARWERQPALKPPNRYKRPPGFSIRIEAVELT